MNLTLSITTTASRSKLHVLRTVLSLVLVCAFVSATQQATAQSLQLQEQQAIQKAVLAADPSIVRIETVGGVDLVGELLTGTGPTTGVVVREDGYIITSRFNFLSNPASVLVTLANGQQFAAVIVADDLSRMLTLLKIETTGLVPLTAVPKSEFRVGQWALALGRTFDPKFPNVSVGIVSALDRVWGRALQTDAKTSPVNYGGPLIDLSGRCLGIIVPLSPQEQGETAGVEWYDSGIGFAVPLVDIESVLPRLIEKETLKPGLMGVGFDDQGPVSGAAKVIRVRPESPADEAGLMVDDVIISVNEKPVSKLNDLKHILGSLYAKEVAKLTVQRGTETIQKEITLVDELRSFQFPYLGILPSRADTSADVQGVFISSVLEKTPAATAGLKPGDVIQKVGSTEVQTAKELRALIHRIEPGADAKLTIFRDEKTLPLTAKLVAYPNEPPAVLNPQQIPQLETAPEVKTGRFNEQLPDDGLSFWAYIPENYRADRPWGLLVWVHPPGDAAESETLQAWTEICRTRGIILVGPRAGDVSGWSPDQEAQVKEMVTWIQSRYQLDPARIAVMGREGSGPFASKLAFKYRELFRGLILLDAALRTPPPDSDPDFPQQLVFVSNPAKPAHKLVEATAQAMQKRNFPTFLIERDKADGAAFPPAITTQLGVWIDALDRI